MLNCLKSSKSGAAGDGTSAKVKDKHLRDESMPLIASNELTTLNEIDNNLANEIKLIIKDIEDENQSDQIIMGRLESLMSALSSSASNVSTMPNFSTSVQVKKRLKDSQSGYDNFSLLHYAAKSLRVKLCEYLIDHLGIDTNVESNSQLTPLHVLVKSHSFPKQSQQQTLATFKSLGLCIGSHTPHTNDKKNRFIKTFELLVDKNSDINAVDESKFSVLHHAVFRNNYEAVAMLLALDNLIIESEDENHMTALHVSCKYGFDDISELIVDHLKSSKNLTSAMYDNLPMHLICRNKNENVNLIRKMLEKIKTDASSSPTVSSSSKSSSASTASSSASGSAPASPAIPTPGINQLELILKRLDQNRHTILHNAIESNHLNIVDCLLKDYYHTSALAESPSSTDDVATISPPVVDPSLLEDRNGNLPIHYAAKTCGPDMFKVLVKNNCFSMRRNLNLDNAMHIAAANNSFKFIKEFLAYEKIYAERLNNKELKEYIPSVKCYNKIGYTPLFVALTTGNIKCVEAILAAEQLDLDAKDPKGNSIYHICAEYNSFESMRVLLNKKDPKFVEPLFIKNNREENVIHTAASYGNLEIIKLVIGKLNDGYSSMETYLIAKNKEGKTCFHIACVKGFYNIVEYFLRDLKAFYFLEQVDNDLNTPLILASMNGHLSIVEILLEYGSDLNLKNRESSTALEISCRKGFFEISKVLISKYSIAHTTQMENTGNNDQHPLHIACYEGAYEVVELLLSKGAPIDVLDHDNKNCLDIAISRGHREVVKVLLKDKNWHKLINHTTSDRIDHKMTLLNVAFTKQIGRFSRNQKRENPQLVAMFENKMWDSISIVLDKCKNGVDYEFSKLDPPCKNIQKHPLMLMARSGQETLLKHDTTRKLLDLKWRFIPRFAFYSNLFVYLLFLVLFALYAYQYASCFDRALSTRDQALESTMIMSGFRSTFTYEPTVSSEYEAPIAELITGDNENRTQDGVNGDSIENDVLLSSLHVALNVLIVLSLAKKLIQIILIDRLSFFASLQNWAEMATYIMALATLWTSTPETKLNICSLALLLSFIVFSFLIQKLKVFGLYVLAFRRTLTNSAKFFPIFFLVYFGFILSFRLRTHFGVTYFNSTTGMSFVRTLSMALGELDNDQMGLDSHSFINFLFYFTFIGLMCVITFNLFVGIAVGEIKTVLDEADIQQISMRIIFVLKVQETLKRFESISFLKCFSIRFTSYNYARDEYKFVKTKDKFLAFIRKRFSSIEPVIKLVDPIKRLEDNLNEVARRTNSDLKSIRELLTNQINDVETKLSNSQQRLEDCLVEMNRKTSTNFETTKEDSASQMSTVEQKVVNSQNLLATNIVDLNRVTERKMNELKTQYEVQLNRARLELIESQRNIQSNVKDLASHTDQIGKLASEQFNNINNTFLGLFDKMNSIKNDMEKLHETLDQMKTVQTSIADSSSKLTNIAVDTDIRNVLTDIVDQLLYEPGGEEDVSATTSKQTTKKQPPTDEPKPSTSGSDAKK